MLLFIDTVHFQFHGFGILLGHNVRWHRFFESSPFLIIAKPLGLALGVVLVVELPKEVLLVRCRSVPDRLQRPRPKQENGA